MVVDTQPSHIDQVKQLNAGAVYRLIDRHGPLSRIDLSRMAQLAPASITKIVREMVDAHLVQETEIQDPIGRGRPAVGLVLDTHAWHFLALRIRCGTLTLALRDLSRRCVIEECVSLPLDCGEQLLDRLFEQIDDFFIRHQGILERLTAITLTLPGIIDAPRGIIHRMPFYQVRDLSVGERLSLRVGVPVYIQHDISAWTLAEHLFGAARDTDNVIQVVIDQTVGAGVITSGRLLHAGSRSLVEMGHIQIDPQGLRCYCGNHGCLETLSSMDNILLRAQAQMQHIPASRLHARPLSIGSLCDCALAGDRLARDIISETGRHIGRIVAIMVNLFNPQKILIGSPLNQAGSLFSAEIEAVIHQQALPDYTRHLQVERTQLDNEGTLAGAALIKEALYNGSLLVRLLQG